MRIIGIRVRNELEVLRGFLRIAEVQLHKACNIVRAQIAGIGAQNLARQPQRFRFTAGLLQVERGDRQVDPDVVPVGPVGGELAEDGLRF